MVIVDLVENVAEDMVDKAEDMVDKEVVVKAKKKRLNIAVGNGASVGTTKATSIATVTRRGRTVMG